MHRLSVFFHHIVGNIHQIVDWTDAYGCKASLHPFRRWPDFDILYDSCTVSRTQLAVLYRHLDIVVHILIIAGCRNYRRMEFLSKRSGCFPCNSDDAEAVHSVGCDFIFKYYVIKPQCFDRAASDFYIILEDIDSLFRRFRVHIPVRAQFFNRAHHAAAFYAS